MPARNPLNVLIVEDEVLVAAELGFLVRQAGLCEVGHAMSSAEAVKLASTLSPDLALVDVNLGDGPSGVEAARLIARDCGGVVLFMTANSARLPQDYAGACGVIGKPYSEAAVIRALAWLEYCLREGCAPGPPPLGLTVSPQYRERWRGADLADAG